MNTNNKVGEITQQFDGRTCQTCGEIHDADDMIYADHWGIEDPFWLCKFCFTNLRGFTIENKY